MRRRRPVACIDLDAAQAEPCGRIEHSLEVQIGEGIRNDSDLHSPKTSSISEILMRRIVQRNVLCSQCAGRTMLFDPLVVTGA